MAYSEYLPYIFIAVGTTALAFALFFSSTNKKLKETGIQVEGIIFDKGIQPNSSFTSNNSNMVLDKITVRFVTQDQKWITGVIKQDFRIFFTGQYKMGEKVKVYYDQSDPNNFYVETGQSELIGRIVIALVGLVFIGIGIYKLF